MTQTTARPAATPLRVRLFTPQPMCRFCGHGSCLHQPTGNINHHRCQDVFACRKRMISNDYFDRKPAVPKTIHFKEPHARV